jgi:DNA mismatch repair protein MutH
MSFSIIMYEIKKFDYDSKDSESIYKYAKKLVNKTLREMAPSEMVVRDAPAVEVKGKFGQHLEKYYFGIENNSDSEPDFKEAGLELKSTPIKKLQRGGYSPKERLVLNIINFDTIVNETWETSHFLQKNKFILFVIYLYENDKFFLDYLIKYVNLWKLQNKDKEIIKQDWQKIVNKIKEGKAHELSEGDTFYLGACRKGHLEKPRGYSCGDIPAKQRAFSFKTKFMKTIIDELQDSETLIKDIDELKTKSFEEIVYNKFREFLGLNTTEIESKLGVELNKSKNYYEVLARRMMGITSKKIEEFEKADVKLKIIRLKHNGRPKEDMSFPAFKYTEVAKQNWEESDFCGQLETKFFFIVYQMNKDESEIIFKKAFFWNMPTKDIEEAEKVWLKSKELINKNIYDSFPKKSENNVSHVRPHARNKEDTNEGLDRKQYTKKCFWLNAQYIQKQIEEN